MAFQLNFTNNLYLVVGKIQTSLRKFLLDNIPDEQWQGFDFATLQSAIAKQLEENKEEAKELDHCFLNKEADHHSSIYEVAFQKCRKTSSKGSTVQINDYISCFVEVVKRINCEYLNDYQRLEH